LTAFHFSLCFSSPLYSQPSRTRPISVRHDTRFLEWVRNPFFNWLHRRNNEGIELPAVVDVPLGQGDHVSPHFFPSRTSDSTYVIQRNYSTRDVRVKKEKEKVRDTKNAKNVKNAAATPMTPVIATTSAHTTHSTRFWPTTCCTSAQNTDDHH
jgi:hypothetical protein